MDTPQSSIPEIAPMQSKSVYYPDLDGLRAICVLLVIQWHLREKSALLTHIPGWVGVYIFFVISGFLITALLLVENAQTQSINLRSFYLRRVFRIVPVYWAVLALYIAYDIRNPVKWQDLKSGLPFYVSFLNEFKPTGATIFGYTWTLGIEEKFYLVWPLLFFCVFKKSRQRSLLLGSLYVLFLLIYPFAERMSVAYTGLLVGCTLSVAMRRGNKVFSLLATLPRFLVFVLTLAGFAVVDWNSHLLVVVEWIFFLLVGSLVARPGSFLAWPPLVWIGRRSYSMYLIHGLVLGFIESRIGIDTALKQILVVSLAFGFAAVLADVIYRSIEAPCRRYGKRLIARYEMTKSQSEIDHVVSG